MAHKSKKKLPVGRPKTGRWKRCLICTRVLWARPSEEKRGAGKYCSTKCRNKAYETAKEPEPPITTMKKKKRKKIIIIGNGESIIGSGLGKLINAADVVIRFNAFIDKPEKDVGSKTTIWFGYMKPHKLIKTFKKVIFWQAGKVNIQHKHEKFKNICRENNIKLRKIPEEVIERAYNELGFTYPNVPKPTGGFGAIVWARFYVWPESDIFITGFDFYEGISENTNTFKKHRPEREKEVITKWLSLNLIKKL